MTAGVCLALTARDSNACATGLIRQYFRATECPVDRFNGYQEWAATQTRRLAQFIGVVELERISLTRYYWALPVIDPGPLG